MDISHPLATGSHCCIENYWTLLFWNSFPLHLWYPLVSPAVFFSISFKGSVVASLQDGPQRFPPQSFPCIVTFHIISWSDGVTNRIWLKWLHVTSKIRLQKTIRLPFWFFSHSLFCITYSRRSQLLYRGPSGSIWKGPLSFPTDTSSQ